MRRVPPAIDFLRENLRSAKRGAAWRGQTYEKTPSAILGAGAAGQFRDRNAWRVVVGWGPTAEASQAYVDWKDALALTAGEVARCVRVELRHNDRGEDEMRVLAAPDLAAAVE